jgi:hypothetical protein
MDGVFRAVTPTAFLRLRDVPIGQPGADAHPCDLELGLAVLKFSLVLHDLWFSCGSWFVIDTDHVHDPNRGQP